MFQQGLSRDYYLTKIQHIEQDIRENENGIVILYQKKATLIREWAECEEALGTPCSTICAKIVRRLIELDCKGGIRHVYRSLPDKYKDLQKSELTKAGLANDDDLDDVTNVTLYKLPHELPSLEIAPAEALRDNEEFLREKLAELRRRHHEYVAKMQERGIPLRSDGDREPESTLRPYDPVKGHLWHAAEHCHNVLLQYAETFRQVMENIEHYPPQDEAEDKELAESLLLWARVFEALDEYFRPFADEKYSQSWKRWWHTQVLNAYHGKHAAAVMSKVDSYLGESRTLTREQVGDKQIEIYQGMIKFAGALEFIWGVVEKLPEKWHQKLMVPCIADRKNRVHSILSEGAFGSDRRK